MDYKPLGWEQKVNSGKVITEWIVWKGHTSDQEINNTIKQACGNKS